MADTNTAPCADKIHVPAFDVRPLSELPSREGFKFRGIPKAGGRYMNCRLKHLPGCGMYIVDQGGYVYADASDKLAGWTPHPKTSRRAPADRERNGANSLLPSASTSTKE